ASPVLPPALERHLASLVARPEPPLEGELWDAERLYRHGRLLAQRGGGAHVAVGRVDLKRLLRQDSRTLHSAYQATVAALAAGRSISPAAQWLVDNFHVVSDQLLDAPLRLTPALWRRLPPSAHPDAAG